MTHLISGRRLGLFLMDTWSDSGILMSLYSRHFGTPRAQSFCTLHGRVLAVLCVLSRAAGSRVCPGAVPSSQALEQGGSEPSVSGADAMVALIFVCCFSWRTNPLSSCPLRGLSAFHPFTAFPCPPEVQFRQINYRKYGNDLPANVLILFMPVTVRNVSITQADSR